MAAPALQRDRERNPDRTREEILRAAEVLFAEQGYEATSLSDVGRAAGVSRATPGYFFGSKLELYRAVLDRSFEEVRDAVRQGRARARRAARDPEVVLAGVVSDYFDFVAARPNFVRLIQREALSDAPNLQGVSLGPAAGREMVAALAEELELDRTEAGDVAQLLFSLIALTWFPLLHGHTLGRVVGLDPSAPGFLEARKRHVTELLVAWLRARRAGVPSLPSA
ncbi:MAG: TetR/AcrR family transcriptional regulator [Gemmatimonadales bacterium]